MIKYPCFEQLVQYEGKRLFLQLNRVTERVLGLSKKVRFLINEKRMQIAVIPPDGFDEDGADFAFDTEGKENPIYVKEPAILKDIQKLTVLEKNGTSLALTIKGMAYPDEKAIIYDLDEAVEIVVKPRGRQKKEKLQKL